MEVNRAVLSWKELTKWLLWEYGSSMVTIWFDELAGSKARNRRGVTSAKGLITNYIRGRGKVVRTQMLMAFSNRGIRSEHLSQVVGVLRDEGLIEETREIHGGRPATWYKWVG